MQISKDIISFDGNVYTGKTTLIYKIKGKLNANVVKEHSAFIDEKEYAHKGAWQLQKAYLKAEEKRLICLSDSEINLLDRSIVSQAAHVYACYHLNIIDLRREFISYISKNTEKIIIPNLYIHIKCPYGAAKKRFLIRENSNEKKDTASLLIDKTYFYLIDKFIRLLFKGLPSFSFNPETYPTEKVVNIIKHNLKDKEEVKLIERIKSILNS